MPITTVSDPEREASLALARKAYISQPETFRIPKATERDPFFGCTRTFYYQGEARGYWRLIRITEPGKTRGVTLVPFAEVARFIQERMGGKVA